MVETSMSKLIEEMHTQHLLAKEASVVGQIGLEFRQTVNVRIAKPFWMPDDVYRMLMRTIVVEESLPSYKVTGR